MSYSKKRKTSLTSSGGGRGRVGRSGWGNTCEILERSTARLIWHWGQLKRGKPCGTLSMALQLAHGSWILVGSMPGDGAVGCCINWGGSICGSWHVGQTNSVRPGMTVRTILQPAQRTWQPAAGTEPSWAGGGGGGGAIGGGGNEGCPMGEIGDWWRCGGIEWWVEWWELGGNWIQFWKIESAWMWMRVWLTWGEFGGAAKGNKKVEGDLALYWWGFSSWRSMCKALLHTCLHPHARLECEQLDCSGPRIGEVASWGGWFRASHSHSSCTNFSKSRKNKILFIFGSDAFLSISKLQILLISSHFIFRCSINFLWLISIYFNKFIFKVWIYLAWIISATTTILLKISMIKTVYSTSAM